MRKLLSVVLAVGLFVVLFSSCNPKLLGMELEIINDTDTIIDRLYLITSVTQSRKMGTNALLDENTIEAGQKMSFYLPPYPDDIQIEIASYRIDPITGVQEVDENSYPVTYRNTRYLGYENLNVGRNRKIVVTYSENELTPNDFNIAISGNGYIVQDQD